MKTKTETEPRIFKEFKVNDDSCKAKVSDNSIILGAWADMRNISTILDVGTGSGVVALMAAQRALNAQVTGIEIDSDSAVQAAQNFLDSPFSDRLSLVEADVKDYAKQVDVDYDLILCNPPIFSGGNLSNTISRNVLRKTKKLPLGDLLAAMRTLLNPKGKAVVVLPYIEGLRFGELASSYGLYPIRILQVRAQDEQPIERLVIHLERKRQEPVRFDLILNYENGEPTRMFKKLTKDFIDL